MELANKPVKKCQAICWDKLNKSQLALSLVMEGIKGDIIHRNTVDNIQAQIMLLLRDLILNYTRGESNSVKTETAEGILNSILYSIDAGLESFSDHNEAIDMLFKCKVNEIYKLGIEVLRACVDETRKIYIKAKESKLDIPIEAYNLTIDNGFSGFLDKYDIVFGAHDTMVDIDYPLANDDMSIRGIFYVRQYLEKLEMENEFCRLFDTEEIKGILKGYGKIYSIDYAVTLTNIFEIVLNNSIFSVIAGNGADKLIISQTQYEFLKDKFTGLSYDEVNNIIYDAMNRIVEALNIKQKEMVDYIHLYNTTLSQRIVISSEGLNLQKLIIIDDKTRTPAKKLAFSDGERMSDKSFRTLSDKILKCQNTTEKIKLIMDNIHSLQDLLDIFNGDCMFENEFSKFYSSMDDMELAVLGKSIFAEELRYGYLEISNVILSSRNFEYEWQRQYINYICTVHQERMTSVEELINSII